MTDLQKQIELLEEQGYNSELVALLACDPDTRGHNRLLTEILREEAQTLRRQVPVIAAAELGTLLLHPCEFNQK